VVTLTLMVQGMGSGPSGGVTGAAAELPPTS
jgi:hypothetical protein